MLFTVLGICGIKCVGYAVNTQSGKNCTNEFGMYKDGNGNFRLKSNGRKVVETFDNNGDCILKYVSNGTPIVNITKAKANEREQKAISYGKRFYLRQPDNGFRSKLGDDTIFGERYCEVGKPHTYYVKRTISYTDKCGNGYVGDFYMDMACNLVCPTEEQIRKDNKNTDNKLLSDDNTDLYQEIIKEWSEYISGIYTSVKYKTCISIGKTNKNAYREYSDKINKWK